MHYRPIEASPRRALVGVASLRSAFWWVALEPLERVVFW